MTYDLRYQEKGAEKISIIKEVKRRKKLFPLIDIKGVQIEKIKEEAEELALAGTDEDMLEEALDVIHAAETFIYNFYSEDEILSGAMKVLDKNLERGYYK